MQIIDTRDQSQMDGLNRDGVYWVYNGLDCCVTDEVRSALVPLLDDVSRATYAQTMRMQAPMLDMMLRGLRVDHSHKARVQSQFRDMLTQLEKQFTTLCTKGLGLYEMPNWRSHTQVKHLLYTVMNLPVIRERNTNGLMAPSSSRATLEALCQHFTAEPICNHILAMRDISKKLGFLKTELDPDARMRCNFNLAGTNTGRLSSSFSDFGRGTNLQNVDKLLRYIFVADPGMVFVNVDLEQADSRNVGAICHDLFYDMSREDVTKYMRVSGYLKSTESWTGPIGPEFAASYLNACESGDLHTTVCQMAWTDLAWDTTDDPRSVADMNAYRDLSYRDMAKKLGHGTNYLGKPKTMAGHTKVPTQQIAEFQHNYFAAFPCIPAWHGYVMETLRTTGQLTNLFGRRRFFFNRLTEQSTVNAAIAYSPQGSTGDEINTGILNLWRDGDYQLLVQVHDSILFQVPRKQVKELTERALELLKAPIMLKGGREFFVPLDAQTGWNWGYRYEDKDTGKVTNPSGLANWKGDELRQTPRQSYQRLSFSGI